MKAKAREAKTVENQRQFTGGGPAIPDMDAEHVQVLSTIPALLPVVKVLDSDAVVNKNDDDDSQFWLHHKTREVLNEELRTEDEIIEVPTTIHVELPSTSSTTLSVTKSVVPQVTTSTVVTTTTAALPADIYVTTPSATPAHQVSAPRVLIKDRRRRTEEPTVEDLKRKIMEQDLLQREQKFQTELNHLRTVHEMEINHKRNMYKLLEEEMKLKIQVLKQQLNNT